MTDDQTTAALQALRLSARRSSVARRLDADAEQALLQTIVEATVTLFEAEASSIALFERDPDRLEFRVAAGAQGAGAIGLSVPPSRGIVGFVFSTGQPLALSDVMSDPRFDRAAAERTGYVPRSIAAVPLVDQEQTVGVLQVLDKHTSPTFSLRDMELLAVFARQAAAAIRAARVQRDSTRLLRAALAGVGDEQLTPEQVDVLVSAASDELDTDEDSPFWQLVDRVARLRDLSDREQRLVSAILEVVADHASRGRRSA
ncbi:MAG TPA: GAF domain-containing protein [Candidatus Limnocylindrales bacterium]|nr:GAF domain-containing protein [Candidatus Limnocylindrales bacterium]